MMMNIRGLAFDDPCGSQVTHLPTLQFQFPLDVLENTEDIDV